MPNRFDGVELRAVRRQQTQMKTMAVAREPLSYFGSLVVRRIVMNEEDFLLPVALRHGTEKRRVTFPLEHLPVRVVESGPVEIHRPQYLLCVSLTGRRNQRLVSAPRPSLVEAGILAEAGFVAEEQSRLALSRFFLAWDRRTPATRLAP